MSDPQMNIEQAAEEVLVIEQAGAASVIIESPVVKYEMSGAGGGFFSYEQTVPATTWTVQHNLGYFPAVTVVDSSNSVIMPLVQQPDNMNVVIRFTQPTTGKVYCS